MFGYVLCFEMCLQITRYNTSEKSWWFSTLPTMYCIDRHCGVVTKRWFEIFTGQKTRGWIGPTCPVILFRKPVHPPITRSRRTARENKIYLTASTRGVTSRWNKQIDCERGSGRLEPGIFGGRWHINNLWHDRLKSHYYTFDVKYRRRRHRYNNNYCRHNDSLKYLCYAVRS